MSRATWTRRALLTAVLPVALTCAGYGPPERDAAENEAGEPPAFASPELAVLELFIGPWRVTEEHFNTQGAVVATVSGTEEAAWILDRHAIRRTYTTTASSTVFEAVGTLTWSDAERAYRGVWFDNVSTSGFSTVMGEWDADAKTMVFSMDTPGKDGATLRHRVVDRFTDKETRVVTTYRIDGGDMVKRLEVRYRRARPCPDKIRIIFDG